MLYSTQSELFRSFLKSSGAKKVEKTATKAAGKVGPPMRVNFFSIIGRTDNLQNALQ